MLERRMDRGFGDPKKPLLVSVRSGAKVSMPGMMDTVLNLGLNAEVAEGLATTSGDRRFAMDAYRRFITMYSDVVLGVHRAPFEAVMTAARQAAGKQFRLRARCRAAREDRRAIREDRAGEDGRAVPQRSQAAAARRDRCGVPLLGHRSRSHVPQAARHPRLARDRVQRAGDGVWQPRRSQRDGCRVHAQPGDRRARVLWRVPAERPGRGRGRGHSHASAAARARGGVARGVQGAARDRASARAALRRHAGLRVHDRRGQAVHACRRAPGSGPVSRRCASPRRWSTRVSSRERKL